MNPKNHSFSRLNTFTSICERRHAFDALVPEKADSPALRRGTHVHDALENMAELIIAGETAVAAAEAVGDDPPEGSLSRDVLRGYLDRAVPVFEHLAPLKGGVEAWFRKIEGMPIVGKIDLQSKRIPIFDERGLPVGSKPGLCVLDHKTTSSPARIQDGREARRSLQLRIYCLATEITTAGFLWFLPSGPVRGTLVEFTPEELETSRKWLQEELGVVDSRWAEAARKDGPGPQIEGYDLSSFALAAPGHGLCSEKHCRHWFRCLGAPDTKEA